MAQPFFILAALGLPLLFVRVPEAAAPLFPGEALSLPVEAPPRADPLPPDPGASQAGSPSVLPDVPAVRTAGALVLAEDPVEPGDQSPIERLVIPDLDVAVQVVLKPRKENTWDISGLRADVAWLEGTAHPSAGGNTVLAGHIMVRDLGKGPFRYLDRLMNGAAVLVYTRRNLYVYQVREQVLVKDSDGQVTFDTTAAQLTMLTCSNWDASVERYQRRRAVFADLVKVEPLPAADALGVGEVR